MLLLDVDLTVGRRGRGLAHHNTAAGEVSSRLCRLIGRMDDGERAGRPDHVVVRRSINRETGCQRDKARGYHFHLGYLQSYI